jgi:hypothetical protein
LTSNQGARSAPTSRATFYEGLLEKNAQDTKSGAGQYFTPRILTDAIVEAMRPQPGTTIINPAAGTGGFLLSAANHLLKGHNLDRDQKRHLQTQTRLRVRLQPENRYQRTETERFRCFSYDNLIQRDKANLDIFGLRDDSPGDSSDHPDSAILASEIVEDLQAALDQFAQIAADLGATESEAEGG